MTTIYDFPFPGASPTGIDFGAFLLSHGGRCAPTVGYSPEATNGLLLICSLTMSITIKAIVVDTNNENKCLAHFQRADLGIA